MTRTFEALQMTADTISGRPDHEAVVLVETDVPDMLELADEAQPGPFLSRTPELGTYLGIRRGGRLIAMAGERMSVPGWTEVSAVCTAADHRGQGLGTRLIHALVNSIVQGGRRPFLHVTATNTNAIRLYDDLGFTTRCRLTIAVVSPPGTVPPKGTDPTW